MKRNIIKIDEELCNGCGLCVDACHEGALKMIEGKARLVSDSYCDGLGACLPECPTGAISIEEREAEEFSGGAPKVLACGCPGTQSRSFDRDRGPAHPAHPSHPAHPAHSAQPAHPAHPTHSSHSHSPNGSELRQWPVQIQLVPVHAPWLDKAHLLIAADCTAFSFADFHQSFMKGRITLIGCPKLDNADYAQKLTEILKRNDIISITVVRMEVPCCGGIVQAAKTAMMQSGKLVPWQVITLGTDGAILED
ncbi:MAG TPA: ferredoxin [Clostridiales bacterium]|nr:ferredoxin [Clostridiales bacterium]